MQDGRHLAELTRHYHHYRADYLEWVARRGYTAAEALPNYHRALVAWYEAILDRVDPYGGDTYDYLTSVAEMYFGGETPLAYLPRTVHLDGVGQQWLRQLRQAGRCGELLILADYHRLDAAALRRAFDLAPLALTEEVHRCREKLAVYDPAAPPWPDVVTLAGRQDLIAKLEREEAVTSDPPAPAFPQETMPPVELSRKRRAINLPPAGILLAGVLFGVLGWLAYDTVDDRSPQGLYTTYFTAYPNIFADQPPQTEDERDLQRILHYYDRAEYRAAYEELLPTADAYPAAPLYLGVTALALGDGSRARQWFARLPADSPYLDAADWYDALARLQLGGLAGAQLSLEAIATAPGHPYRTHAQQLLSDL